jgi:hypothetical protein
MSVQEYGSQNQYQISSADRIGGYLISFSHASALTLITSDNLTDKELTVHQGVTALNFLSYIPGLNLIIGIARIIFSQISEAFQDEHKPGEAAALREAQIVRGVTECLCVFGPVLLLIDIAATAFFLIIASLEN